MQFYIHHLSYLIAESSIVEQGSSQRFAKEQLPVLDWVPAMQRRRLSAFTKIALHCAHQALDGREEIPVVFSTRHGDIHKTAGLLDTVAAKESLSPTAFSMSVHNASAGLLSILTNNVAASNTVSAGKDTFLAGVIDAYARLKSSEIQEILVIHCDQALPEEYQVFSDEKQIDHAVAFILSKQAEHGRACTFDLIPSHETLPDKDIPQAIAFIDAMNNNSLAEHHIVGARNTGQIKLAL
ncbi:beta-ketoacyl synthase chain length factor [Thalassotalea marina]|uniref:Beta-ketoacyl synthase-like N-terminal domain-containing protein n=1 Tax=Thalassotalea marina TaxID=1673741 RepID=A0A919BKY4_9GAMM|nr:beta-ketoacyl synthase chain length factor [Thalassotalea marina]GHF97195.1 hypothetical protein GCM10017161_26670 [Thalassotalea marina]